MPPQTRAAYREARETMRRENFPEWFRHTVYQVLRLWDENRVVRIQLGRMEWLRAKAIGRGDAPDAQLAADSDRLQELEEAIMEESQLLVLEIRVHLARLEGDITGLEAELDFMWS